MGSRKAPAVQSQLPGVDGKIKELESKALEYAAARDARMEALEVEIKHKRELLEMLHKHGKKVYKTAEIEISIVESQEKIKVRVRKDDEPEK